MYAETTLEITGYGDEPVPHTFLQQQTETRHIAIILPGLAYGCDHPLLYYPSRLLLDRGADVLRVEYDYHKRGTFTSLSDPAQARRFFADVTAACSAGLAQRAYQHVTLVGKSMGTLAMGHLFATGALPDETRAVWLTPLLRIEHLRAQIMQCGRRSLFVIGTADAHYDAALLSAVQGATRGDSVVVEGTDHSVEIPGDVMRSLEAMQQVMRAVQAFLA